MLSILLTLAPTLAESQLVRGTVVDDGTDHPVGVVDISLLGPADAVLRTTTSDRDGQFIIGVSNEGEYRLRAERLGYETVTTAPLDLQRDSILEVVIRLSSDAILLDPLEVVGRGTSEINRATFEGLYQRRARSASVGFDRVFVRGDPELDDAMTVGEFLRLHAGSPGRLRRPGSGSRGRGCWAGILFRGSPVPGPQYSVILELRLYELEGIEIYRRPENAPPDLRPIGNTPCGFAVVWPQRMGDEPW